MSDNGKQNGSHNPKHNSIPLTEGPSRAAARAMLHAVGFNREDLAKPIIGIANTWTEIGPCNFHLRILAEAVKQGIRDAGGTPMEFNTVTISDGITMGTQGMKASLISREIIADSVELVARGNLFDGVIAIAGCDKNLPGTVMALARLDIPSLMLYGGSIAPGHLHGKDLTVQDVFEAQGSYARGKIDDAETKSRGGQRVSRSGRMRRSVHSQHHGHGMRISWHISHESFRYPRAVSGKSECLPYCWGAGSAAGEDGSATFQDYYPRGAGERHRQRSRLRRIDQCRATPDRHCA